MEILQNLTYDVHSAGNTAANTRAPSRENQRNSLRPTSAQDDRVADVSTSTQQLHVEGGLENGKENDGDEQLLIPEEKQSDVVFLPLDFRPIPTEEIEDDGLRAAMLTLDDDSEPSVLDLGEVVKSVNVPHLQKVCKNSKIIVLLLSKCPHSCLW